METAESRDTKRTSLKLRQNEMRKAERTHAFAHNFDQMLSQSQFARAAKLHLLYGTRLSAIIYLACIKIVLCFELSVLAIVTVNH